MSSALIKTQGSSSAELFTDDDLKREFGGQLAANQLDTRIKALTKPGDYATDLKAALDDANSAAAVQFDAIYKKYVAAGLPREQAKTLAIQEARSTYQASMNVVRLTFPETASGIYALGEKIGTGATPFKAMSMTDILGESKKN